MHRPEITEDLIIYRCRYCRSSAVRFASPDGICPLHGYPQKQTTLGEWHKRMKTWGAR